MMPLGTGRTASLIIFLRKVARNVKSLNLWQEALLINAISDRKSSVVIVEQGAGNVVKMNFCLEVKFMFCQHVTAHD